MGTQQPYPVDTRIIATSESLLGDQIRKRQFDEALFDHLSLTSISLPPLRELREEIPPLTYHLLNTLRPPNSPPISITGPALRALLRYDWPGNVRQLCHELEQAIARILQEPAPTIDRRDLSDTILESINKSTTMPHTESAWSLPANQNLDDVLAMTEKAFIEQALFEHRGRVTTTAEALGLSRQGLYKKMKRLNIDPTNFQAIRLDTSLQNLMIS